VANLKVESLLKEFHRLGVEFVIIGGMAAVAHGSAYLTLDLDLCYSRKTENLEKLAQALAPFHPLLRGAPPFSLDTAALNSGLNFTLTTDLGDLDLLGEVAGFGGYAEVSSASQELELYGTPCKVLSLQGLIKSKKAAGRAKDLRLLPELEALFELNQLQKKISNAAICKAIRNKAVLQFTYECKLRIVEPQCHGISTAGNEVMRGSQTGGRSRSRRSIAEKLFEVAKISELKETGDTFSDPGPNYNPNDQAMIYVHCHL
jgi:predicted nucleotidyltransferase